MWKDDDDDARNGVNTGYGKRDWKPNRFPIVWVTRNCMRSIAFSSGNVVRWPISKALPVKSADRLRCPICNGLLMSAARDLQCALHCGVWVELRVPPHQFVPFPNPQRCWWVQMNCFGFGCTANPMCLFSDIVRPLWNVEKTESDRFHLRLTPVSSDECYNWLTAYVYGYKFHLSSNSGHKGMTTIVRKLLLLLLLCGPSY